MGKETQQKHYFKFNIFIVFKFKYHTPTSSFLIKIQLQDATGIKHMIIYNGAIHDMVWDSIFKSSYSL